MKTLKERLDHIRTVFRSQAPPEALAVVDRAASDLNESGILSRVLKVGDALPPFALHDTEGGSVRSDELLGAGPLVVTVYRGVW